jgi:excisionase family DNA binding protein
MAFRNRKKEKEQPEGKAMKEKILDVDASMQGSLTFRDPVNLRINGNFEGSLDTKGNLTVGENARVQANINGENIVVSGHVFGNIVATHCLSLTSTAYVVGDIRMPKLSIAEGAILQGKCQMETKKKEVGISTTTVKQTFMTVEELAKYLEVDSASIADWAKSGKIPAQREGDNWRFDRTEIDLWIASEKIKK